MAGPRPVYRRPRIGNSPVTEPIHRVSGGAESPRSTGNHNYATPDDQWEHPTEWAYRPAASPVTDYTTEPVRWPATGLLAAQRRSPALPHRHAAHAYEPRHGGCVRPSPMHGLILPAAPWASASGAGLGGPVSPGRSGCRRRCREHDRPDHGRDCPVTSTVSIQYWQTTCRELP